MDSPLNILYEDNHIISVNKSNNDLVQKDITGDLALDDKVREYIRIKYSKPGDVFLGVVHRIDRPVSGAVLFARTSKTLGRLNKMLRENLVNKKYWAVVRNKPPQNQDMLVNYLVKNPKQNKSYCYDRSVPGSKEARLEYRIAAKSDNYYLLEINLITGRHHQIRAQLSHINCPVKGDLKYGFPRSNENGGIHLHSREINFKHPVKKNPVRIIADPPQTDILWKSIVQIVG